MNRRHIKEELLKMPAVEVCKLVLEGKITKNFQLDFGNSQRLLKMLNYVQSL